MPESRKLLLTYLPKMFEDDSAIFNFPLHPRDKIFLKNGELMEILNTIRCDWLPIAGISIILFQRAWGDSWAHEWLPGTEVHLAPSRLPSP